MTVDTSCWVKLDGIVEPPKCPTARGVARDINVQDSTPTTVTHGLGTMDIIVQTWSMEKTGRELSPLQVTMLDANTIQVQGMRQGLNPYRILIIPLEAC